MDRYDQSGMDPVLVGADRDQTVCLLALDEPVQYRTVTETPPVKISQHGSRMGPVRRGRTNLDHTRFHSAANTTLFTEPSEWPLSD